MAMCRLFRRTSKTPLVMSIVTIASFIVVFNLLFAFVLHHKSTRRKHMSGTDQEFLRQLQNRSLENPFSLDKTLRPDSENQYHLPMYEGNRQSLEVIATIQNAPHFNFTNNVLIAQSRDIQNGNKQHSDNLPDLKHRPDAGLINGHSNLLNENLKTVSLLDARKMPIPNERDSGIRRVSISLEDYKAGMPTGNPLIDNYGKNNLSDRGEMGKPVVLTPEEEARAQEAMSEFNVNIVASDVTPLNRLVPDSRLNKCDQLKYDTSHLPTASIIIPFYDEWPSLLLRTIYSVINRSPRHLVKEIILIDDASTLEQLKNSLEEYIDEHFPQGLVRLVRIPVRSGLIQARMRGCHEAKGDVLIFFDSHMEVNIDWLEPLLTEIAKNKTVVAMSTLDYVQRDSLEYKYNHDYLTRYGWDWRMVFFETLFREDQIGPDPRNPREGATMVGAAFAIDKQYFLHLGGYDESMTVWGGENLEMGWRVWQCGGRLMHVPCSRIGHVPRSQPYSFPGGRKQVEHFNYKRAISVWMGNYSRYVYSIFPDMKDLNVGDISARLDLKARLGCHDFKWYINHVWPELAIFDENVKVWGQVRNKIHNKCLDNDGHLFQYEADLHFTPCDRTIDKQGFSLTNDNLLQTSLQCVVCHDPSKNPDIKLEDCIIGTRDKWDYTKDQRLLHIKSNLCLDVGTKGPMLKNCTTDATQIWTFHPFQL
ncbi:polypeptide N-acetylgalactosaminyltransferase 1 [Biomphalaria glabrata]|nr:polypeptide N-acetylgalactosaminyltransferase 1-like [Biomphalaria glabrata]